MMITLLCTYHHGSELRQWYVTADTLSAAIREAYKGETMSADMRDAVYGDLLDAGFSERYSWLRVKVCDA